MRKPKIYLDTSVISHLKQDDVPEKMADTNKLWEDIKSRLYYVYISNIMVEEIADNTEPKRSLQFEYLSEIEYNIVTVNEEIVSYARKLNQEGILSEKHMDDCLHIGCAVISECNIIFSWNFKHMVKVKTVNGVRSINAMLGYHGIDIYSPTMIVD